MGSAVIPKRIEMILRAELITHAYPPQAHSLLKIKMKKIFRKAITILGVVLLVGLTIGAASI